MALLLYFKTSTSDATTAIEVDMDATVGDLRHAIASAGGPPATLQRFMDGPDLSDDSMLLADSGVCSELLINVEAHNIILAAGADISVALHEQEVWLWGQRIGSPPAEVRHSAVAGIDAGHDFCLALLSGGQVYGWGSDRLGQSSPPPMSEVGPISSVSAGMQHAVALTQQGKVVCWGNQANGRCNPPPLGDERVRKAVAGGHSTALILENGRLIQFGDLTACPDLGDRRVKLVALAPTFGVAVLEGNDIVTWGDPPAPPGRQDYATAMKPEGDIVELKAGLHHWVLRTDAGHVYEWGRDVTLRCTRGLEGGAEVGSGAPTVQRRGRVECLEEEKATAVAAGANHTLMYTTDQKVRAWGENTYCQCLVPEEFAARDFRL